MTTADFEYHCRRFANFLIWVELEATANLMYRTGQRRMDINRQLCVAFALRHGKLKLVYP